MSGIEINHLLGCVLFTSTHDNVRSALNEAVAQKANLRGASLRGANLYGANLYGANLRGADLYGANLRGADLRGANLYGANLYGANLYGANLRGANLYGANLYGANLRGANLYGADLYGANLRGADLYGADLYGANLYGASLYGANLYGANLRGADLYGANLYGANLRGADLCGAKNADRAIAATRILPDGQLIGWKKARDGRIVKLRIPAKAKRSHGSGRKCRAEYAKVLAIYDSAGGVADSAVSQHDPKFVYELGITVRPSEPFDENMWNECSTGIHFFITRLEAENYA